MAETVAGTPTIIVQHNTTTHAERSKIANRQIYMANDMVAKQQHSSVLRSFAVAGIGIVVSMHNEFYCNLRMCLIIIIKKE